MCKGCLARNAPLMVREPCHKFVEECGGKTEGCGIKEGEEYTVEDLMANNGVPNSHTPKWAVIFKNIPGCWNQFGDRDKRAMQYAQKCWDVISWCQGKGKVCPRD